MDMVADHREEVERKLFWQGRELFDYGIDLVFFDTTSVYFEGEGPEGFCERGFSRDHRPDKKQLVIGVLMNRRGYPIACEFWPGNTTDKRTLMGAFRTLRERFKLDRIILVCDRGMVSVENLVELDEAGLEYIVGIPLRRYEDIQEEVLLDPSPFREVADNLQVKEVIHRGFVDGKFVLLTNTGLPTSDVAVSYKNLRFRFASDLFAETFEGTLKGIWTSVCSK